MITKTNLKFSRLWMALSTILIFGVLFAYYFFMYVPEKEELIVQKKYRSLKRLGQNFVTMKHDYERSIKQQIWNHDINLMKCNVSETLKNDQRVKDSLSSQVSVYQGEARDQISTRIKNLEGRIRKATAKQDKCKTDVYKRLNVSLAKLRLSPIPESYGPATFNSYKERFHTRISNPEALCFFTDHLYTTVSLADFISNQLLIDDHFDRFLVIRLFDHSRKYGDARSNIGLSDSLTDTLGSVKEKEKEDSVYSFLAYQGMKYNAAMGSENKILLGDLKDMFDRSHGLASIPIRTVKISGVDYRMFSHVVEMAPDEDWVLSGLVPESDISKESRSVRLIVLIFLVLGFLFLLLAMPALKLLIMSPIERLQRSNILFLGVSIVVGTALAFIIMLASHHYISYEEDYEANLDSLSADVSRRFNLEVADIIGQIQFYSEAEILQTRLDKDSFLLKANALWDVLDSSNLPYPFYNEAMFLNDSGNALITVATHPLPKQPIVPNLKERYYFKDAMQDRLYSLPNAPTSFAIQSILSWNSRVHEAGISIRPKEKVFVRNANDTIVDTLQVFAIATKLRSVMDPLLPPGFAFCIVDRRGEVLFHSQKDKNLQENFLDEAEGNKHIQAALQGELRVPLSVIYNGRKNLVHIRPLVPQSMYLITLYDEEYYHTPIVFTLGLAVFVLGICFAILGIQTALLFLTSYYPTKLRIERFFLYWVRPRVSDADRILPVKEAREGAPLPLSGSADVTPEESPGAIQSEVESGGAWKHFPYVKYTYHERYIRGITVIFLITVLLITVASLNYNTARVLVTVTATVPVFLLMLFFWMLHDDKTGRKYRKKELFLGASVLLIGLIDFKATQLLECSIMYVFLLQGGIVAIMFIAVWTPYVNFLHEGLAGFSKTNMYVIFMCSWLFMVSILPTSIIYKAAYKRETMLWERFMQWETLRLMRAREAHLREELKNFPAILESQADSLERFYFVESDKYGNYIKAGSTSSWRDSALIGYTKIDQAEFRLRPDYDGPMEGSRKALLANINDKSWKWYLRPDTLTLRNKETKMAISTSLGDFSFLKGDYVLFFILVFLVMSGVVYKLIASSVKYIFGLGLLEPNKFSAIAMADQIIDRVRKGNHQFDLFLVGLPFSGKTKLLKHIKERLNKSRTGDEDKPSPYIHLDEVDFRTDTAMKIDVKTETLLVLKHFEYGINDHELNERKFNIIHKLAHQKNVRMIISSAVEPVLLLEVYEKKIEKLVDDKGNDEMQAENSRRLACYRTSYRKWKNMLAGFETRHISFAFEDGESLKESELGIGTYLPKLKTEAALTDLSDEELILEIEEVAATYYHALWNSFSRNEKRILFDLAKDKFVNLRDISHIRLLIKKGVVIMEDAPRIMNRSFNNFILAAVREDEEVAMTVESRQKGTWHSVHLVLVITLISIIIFIALVQEEMLSNFNTTIATVSGVIALLIRFSGMFVGSKVKEG